jgi:hypothetical protein
VLNWYFIGGARSNRELHFDHSFVHAIEVRRLEKNLAARPRQSVAARLEKAADLGGDEVRVLREADPNAYCHAFNGLKLAQLYDCTSRDVLGLVFNCVTELDIEFILLELWGMRYNDQRVWVPLWQELPRMIAQLDNKPTRRAE